MTYLSPEEVKDIVHAVTLHIQIFLGNADSKDHSGDARKAIAAFHKNPGEFSEEELLRKGADMDQAHKHLVRIELRGVTGPDPLRGPLRGGAAQVSAKGIWGQQRQKTQAALTKELLHKDSITVCVAGSSTLEFTRRRVNKALPINYLRACWQEVLTAMDYKAGPAIDSRARRIVIAADGDDTMYSGPQTTHLPLLKESPAFAPLVKYLKAGGLFMLISGNDLLRTYRRVIEGLPKEVYSRFLISANGGADLAYLGKDGKPVFIKEYRHTALEVTAGKAQKPALDMFYIGDDDSKGGNDFAAFETVGKDRGVCVHSLKQTKEFLERWLHERKIGAA